MSDRKDFVIEDGVLLKYTGPGGDVVPPQQRDEYRRKDVFWLRRSYHSRPGWELCRRIRKGV